MYQAQTSAIKSGTILTILVYALILVGVLRMLVINFTSPIMAYGNNYDFIRQSSCTGLWQNYPDRLKTEKNADAPVNALIFDGDKNPELCLISVDNIFPYIATIFHRIGDRVDFREVSLWKVVFIVIFALLLFLQIGSYAAKVSLAVIFLLVFGDFGNLLYLNTFYQEFSVICASFLSLSAVVLLVEMPDQPKKGFIALTIFSLIWLGLAKQQYLPFASVLSLAAAAIVFLRWRTKPLFLIFFLVSILIPVVYGQLNKGDTAYMRSLNFANKTDAFLDAVLPEATDKQAALSYLGLPSSCMDGIGKSWYSPGVALKHPCPEVEHLSRFQLIKLFVLDPPTFYMPLYKAVVRTNPFGAYYLGYLENPADPRTQRYESLFKGTSFTTFLALFPPQAQCLLALLSVVCGGVLFCNLAAWTSSKELTRLILAMIAVGGGTTIYTIASSVFGDAYVEIPRHAMVFMIGAAFQICGIGLASAYLGRVAFDAAFAKMWRRI